MSGARSQTRRLALVAIVGAGVWASTAPADATEGDSRAEAHAASHKAHHHAKDDTATRDKAADPVASVVTPDIEVEHVVRAGETLGGIAHRAKVPRVLIIETNGLKPPYTVHAGQRLSLPRTRHHIVQPDETGFDIAYRYGVPYSAIAVANGLKPDDPLSVGQKLLIPTVMPGAAPAPASTGKGEKAETGKSAKGDAGGKDAASDVKHSDADATQAAASTAHDAAAPDFVWPVNGKVVRGYAPRNAANHHDGVDIEAPGGSAVRATASGEVIFAGAEPQSFGKLVVIDHHDGWQSAYGFLGKLTVAKGDSVHARERIGTVGHTGKAPRDELHFEIRQANEPIDPMTQLPAKDDRQDASASADGGHPKHARAEKRAKAEDSDTDAAPKKAHRAKAKPKKAQSGD